MLPFQAHSTVPQQWELIRRNQIRHGAQQLLTYCCKPKPELDDGVLEMHGPHTHSSSDGTDCSSLLFLFLRSVYYVQIHRVGLSGIAFLCACPSIASSHACKVRIAPNFWSGRPNRWTKGWIRWVLLDSAIRTLKVVSESFVVAVSISLFPASPHIAEHFSSSSSSSDNSFTNFHNRTSGNWEQRSIQSAFQLTTWNKADHGEACLPLCKIKERQLRRGPSQASGSQSLDGLLPLFSAILINRLPHAYRLFHANPQLHFNYRRDLYVQRYKSAYSHLSITHTNKGG